VAATTTQAYGGTTNSPGHLYAPPATATILILETDAIVATVQAPEASVSTQTTKPHLLSNHIDDAKTVAYDKHKDSILSSFSVAVLLGHATEAIGCLPLPVLIGQQHLTVIDHL
jgi:hypothetical protein